MFTEDFGLAVNTSCSKTLCPKVFFYPYFLISCLRNNSIQTIHNKSNNYNSNKWQWPALGACSGVRKNISHGNQTEKPKLKMATIGPKQVRVIYLEVISLDSEFQLSSSSNDSDADKYFRSNFCHQEGSGTIFKYSVMLG